MDGWMDGRTDRPSYGDARTHLKTTTTKNNNNINNDEDDDRLNDNEG